MIPRKKKGKEWLAWCTKCDRIFCSDHGWRIHMAVKHKASMTFDEECERLCISPDTEEWCVAQQVWHDAQEAMRERAANAVKAWGIIEDAEDLARLVDDILSLPVE